MHKKNNEIPSNNQVLFNLAQTFCNNNDTMRTMADIGQMCDAWLVNSNGETTMRRDRMAHLRDELQKLVYKMHLLTNSIDQEIENDRVVVVIC